MKMQLHVRILLVALTHLFVIACQAQNKTAYSNDTRGKIVVNQMLPDTLTVKSISLQQEKVKWELYVGAFAVLLIGLITAGVSYMNVNNTIKTSHATTLELTKAQFLQNNTRVWVQDIIESTAKFLNDVAMLSTDTRYHSCIKYQERLSMLEKDYKPMNENKRLDLTKTVDLELSKLMLLLSDDLSTNEGQIIAT